MTIVKVSSELNQFDLAVPLARYAQIIGFKECAFLGVNNPDDSQPGCRSILTKPDRDMLQDALWEAQQEIEQQVNYPLNARWFVDANLPFKYPVQARRGKLIEAGIRAETAIDAGVAVNYAAEPATVTVATTVTDVNEIFVYHPNSDYVIIPSDIQISGGNAVISIPRCRLVDQGKADNPDTGWSYGDLSNFETNVDVKRIYNDDSTNAVLVFPHQADSSLCCCSSCDEKTKTGCMYIRNNEIGSVDVLPATYSEGLWSSTSYCAGLCCNYHPQFVDLYYRAGMNPITRQAEMAVIRLAHSKMPEEICGCDTWTRLWGRDKNTPDVVTAERLNNPFGISDGAWHAWQFVKALRLRRGWTL